MSGDADQAKKGESADGKRLGSPEKVAIIAGIFSVVAAAVTGGFALASSHNSPAQDPGNSSSSTAIASPSPSPSGSVSQAAFPSAPPVRPALTLSDPGNAGVAGVAFSPNGSLAEGDLNWLNGASYLWDTADSQVKAHFRSPKGQGVYGVAFSPRGSVLAVATANSGYTDGGVSLWNTATGKLTATLKDPGGTGVGGGIAFSPDGGELAAADDNGGIYLWNVAAGALIATLHGPAGEGIAGVAFSPRGILAATTDNASHTKSSICVWNGAHKLAATFHDPGSQGAFRLAFSPDGGTLAVGDANANTYLWNMNWLSS